jgi:hypothetical protein
MRRNGGLGAIASLLALASLAIASTSAGRPQPAQAREACATITVGANAERLAFGAPLEIFGRLRPIQSADTSDEAIELEIKDAEGITSGLSVRTDPLGDFRIVSPARTSGRLSATWAGTGACAPTTRLGRWIGVTGLMSEPAFPKDLRAGVRFDLTGTVQPNMSGAVVNAFYGNRTWGPTYLTSIDATSSRYSLPVTIDKPGTYTLKIVIGDAAGIRGASRSIELVVR